jgi:hypothetical protein
MAIVQEERAAGTAWFAASVPLLALAGLAMPDNIRPLAVGAVEDVDDHDVTLL